MMSFVSIIFACVLACVAAHPQPTNTAYPFPFVTRAGWGARPPTGRTNLGLPVEFVVVHHSFIPGACTTQAQCSASMRSIQNTHQLTNGWADIGYNFAVGGEGSVLEGRGWNTVGAHAAPYNARSIGICMIGDFVQNLPPARQLQSLRDLIAAGVQRGFISRNYKLIGHRQVSATECPGQRLFTEISTWPNFTRI